MYKKSFNRRKFHRIEFDGVACLKIEEYNYDCCPIKDLSLTGLFIRGNFQKHEIENYVVRIFSNKNPDQDSVLATGSIVRVTNEGIVIQFTEMTFENYLLLKSTLIDNAKNYIVIISELPDTPPFKINDK